MAEILERIQALRSAEWLEKQAMATQDVTRLRSGEHSIRDERHLIYKDLLERLLECYPDVAELLEQLNEAQYGRKFPISL